MSDENRQDQEEVSLYEKIANRTADLLEEGKKSLDEALKKAKEEVASAGEFTREQADKITSYVRRDIAQLGDFVDRTKKTVKEAAEPQRVLSGAQSVFARILQSTAATLNEWAERTQQQLEYKTGEMTNPGTLTCKACGAEMSMKKTGRIPPCPKCHKTEFRKSY